MESPPESAAAAPRRSPAKRVASLLFVATSWWLIWSANLFFPNEPASGLDPSWQQVLAHAARTDWVFGRDLVYTYGPWGWLTTLYFHADTFAWHMTYELVFKALAAALLVGIAATLTWPRRIALIGTAIFFPSLFQDTLPVFVIAALFVFSLRTRRSSWLIFFAAGAIIGFLALQKFTYLALAFIGLAGLGLFAFDRRETSRAVSLVGGFVVAFVSGWIAAGQPLDAIPSFLKNASHISSGYTEAMFLDETPAVFRAGLFAALLFLCLVWSSPRRETLALSLVLTGFGFLVWKHGFVRADGHVMIFFFAMLFAGVLAPALNPVPSVRRGFCSLALCATVLVGLAFAEPAMLTLSYHTVRLRLVEKTKWVFKLPTLAEQRQRETLALSKSHDLPAVRQHVRGATIDQFGNEQAIVLLNELNYHPRPVFQSFQAYSGPLARLNEAFYISPTAPAYTLAATQTIDGRLPALDDAALLPRLVSDHTLVLPENGYLLLQRRPTPAALDRTPLETAEVAWQSTYPIPQHTHAVWARIDAPLSVWGRLRSFLYKPPPIALVLRESSSAEQRFRLVRPAARAGFLLSPLVLDTNDLEAFITATRARTPTHLRLEIAPAHARYFGRGPRLELFTISDLPLPPANGQ